MEKPGFAEGYETARTEIAEADMAARAAAAVEPKRRVMYTSKVDFRTGEHWIREVVVESPTEGRGEARAVSETAVEP